jgi:hypothetical protein
MAQQMAKLPKIMKNPIDMLDMSGYLVDAADALEKQAAEEGKTLRMKPQILRIRSFAREMRETAEARLGTHEADLKKG